MHQTIKFTADWLKTVNFLSLVVSVAEGVILTGKPTDIHQYLLSFCCHSFYGKNGIPYRQALRLDKICSNNEFFDERCNDLEKYLLERGYSEKMVRKKILRARDIPREATSEKVNNLEKQNKITFNTTYHPVLQDVREILQELHLTLASDDAHNKVFPDVLWLVSKLIKT